MMKKILFYIVIVLLMCSCVKASSFKLGGVSAVKVEAITKDGMRCNFDAEFTNSGRKVSILDMGIDIRNGDGDKIISVTSLAPTVILKGTHKAHASINIFVPGGIMGYMSLVSKLSRPGLYVDGYVLTKAGFKKRIDIKPIPLDQINKIFDVRTLKLKM